MTQANHPEKRRNIADSLCRHVLTIGTLRLLPSGADVLWKASFPMKNDAVNLIFRKYGGISAPWCYFAYLPAKADNLLPKEPLTDP